MPLEQLLSSGTILPITRWGNPVLHSSARPVAEFGPDLWNLLCDMFATNAAANGAGLAAPQIGVDLAVFVYDCLDAFGRRRQGLVCNPQITLAIEPALDTDYVLFSSRELPGYAIGIGGRHGARRRYAGTGVFLSRKVSPSAMVG